MTCYIIACCCVHLASPNSWFWIMDWPQRDSTGGNMRFSFLPRLISDGNSSSLSQPTPGSRGGSGSFLLSCISSDIPSRLDMASLYFALAFDTACCRSSTFCFCCCKKEEDNPDNSMWLFFVKHWIKIYLLRLQASFCNKFVRYIIHIVKNNCCKKWVIKGSENGTKILIQTH